MARSGWHLVAGERTGDAGSAGNRLRLGLPGNAGTLFLFPLMAAQYLPTI